MTGESALSSWNTAFGWKRSSSEGKGHGPSWTKWWSFPTFGCCDSRTVVRSYFPRQRSRPRWNRSSKPKPRRFRRQSIKRRRLVGARAGSVSDEDHILHRRLRFRLVGALARRLFFVRSFAEPAHMFGEQLF